MPLGMLAVHATGYAEAGPPTAFFHAEVVMSMPRRPSVMVLFQLVMVAVMTWFFPASAHAQAASKLSFVPADHGTFEFDTGILRGRLRTPQLAFGLHGLQQVPSGQKLAGGHGVMNVYRVFSDGQRYGTAGWDWPSHAQRLDDGSVTVECAADASRPFVLRGSYRWSDPATVDLEIEVTPEKELHGFEVFLASYFDPIFTNCLAYVAKDVGESGQPGLLAAKRSFGDWLMFPRDGDVVEMIQDGRWQLVPNPVDWVIMPTLERPLAVRRRTRWAARGAGHG